MELFENISQAVVSGLMEIYQKEYDASNIQIQETRPEFDGDFTVVTFPFTKLGLGNPAIIAEKLGEYLVEKMPIVSGYEVIKGFLNIKLSDAYWLEFMKGLNAETYFTNTPEKPHTYVVEYSSPNTNKPLHLGHLRNNFLGDAICKILDANGHRAVPVCLYNDRGIAICKSMLMYQKFGEGKTPESEGVKGDFFVVDYYVRFAEMQKEQLAEALIANGIAEKDALIFTKGKFAKEAANLSDEELSAIKKRVKIHLKEQKIDLKKLEDGVTVLEEAREMLRKWEENDTEIRALWKQMNDWVYAGFNVTYDRINVKFEKNYYESETYLLGNEMVDRGLEKGVLFKKEDGSVWIDLTEDGLDEKAVRRSDGTSMYITQDLGTAVKRHEVFGMEKGVYVVADEQDYHFKVLFLILEKLGYDWATGLHHLSYGMVDLPTGKMKSREGTSVDADTLIDEVVNAAREKTLELGKIHEIPEEEHQELYETLGIGALKFFILKVNPRKRMIFDPAQSVNLAGDSGPFIQYAHARVSSMAAKAGVLGKKEWNYSELEAEERVLLRRISSFPDVLKSAADNFDPSEIATFALELTREYNRFFHNVPVLKSGDEDATAFRLHLSSICGAAIRTSMGLLGIKVPSRM